MNIFKSKLRNGREYEYNPYLKQLEEMVEQMPDYNPFYLDLERIMHLETVVGDARSYGVYSDHNLSQAKTIFEPNTILLPHFHKEKEVILVLEGELEIVFVEENESEYSVMIPQYGVLVIEPMKQHFSRNKVKTIIMANLMPFSPQFPLPHDEE